MKAGDSTVIERLDPFECTDWCALGTAGESPEQRASRHCTLQGFRRPWTQTKYVDVARLRLWQGRAKQKTRNGWDARPAEPESEGCPGGWARCGFAQSFLRYIRPRLRDGGHDNNPLIHAATPEHVLEALRFFETHQAKAANEFERMAR